MREKHNIGYCLLATILCLLVNLSIQSPSPSCTISQTRKLQEQYSKCSQKFTETFHGSGAGDVCELLDNIVDTCVELFSTCHSPRDLRRMKDRHILQLMDQYSSDGDLTQCKVVREYRESGRDDPEQEEVGCSDDKSLAAQTGFQQCSHSTSTKVYQSILDMEEPKLEAITDTLCKGLSTIGTLCAKSLTECFAEGDFIAIRKSHLAEMKKFFIGFSPELSASSLDNCKILDYTEVEEVTEAELSTTTMKKIEETTTTESVTEMSQGTNERSIEEYDENYSDLYEDYDEEDYNYSYDSSESEYERVRKMLSRDGEQDVHGHADNPSSDPRASTEAAERLQFTRSASSTIHSVMIVQSIVSFLIFRVIPSLL